MSELGDSCTKGTAASRQPTALVLGSDTRSFLSIVRSLGRYGIRVEAAWSQPNAPALHSQYVSCVHRIPAPWEEPENWIDDFGALLQRQKYDIVVPCNDPSSIPLQLHRDQIREVDRISLLDDDAFQITQCKIRSTQLADELNIPIPLNQVIDSHAQASSFAQDVGYPIILKPGSSFRADQLRRKQSVVRVASDAELSLRLPGMLDSGLVQAQAEFQGVGTGVEFLAQEGMVLYAFQHLRLHEPMKGGGSSYRISIPLHAEMLGATHRIVHRLRYSGVGMIEFRWNQRTNKWIFVEINGRFWGSLPLAIASGADFPKFLYQARVEGRRTFPKGYRVGVSCRNWERDKNWFQEQYSASSLLGFSSTLAKESALALGRALTLRERADTLVLDDLRPGAIESFKIGAEISQAINRRIRSRLDHSFLRRRRACEKIRKQLASARRLLFVCKGNICRSPFAAAYAQQLVAPGVMVESCGYHPVADRRCPAPAVSIAREFGVDLGDHKSKVVNCELLERADLVFVFDQDNHQMIRSQFASYRKKVSYLASYDQDCVYISDPYGKHSETFRRVYTEIKQSLDQHFVAINATVKKADLRDIQP